MLDVDAVVDVVVLDVDVDAAVVVVVLDVGGSMVLNVDHVVDVDVDDGWCC